jgi:hypothetical protein
MTKENKQLLKALEIETTSHLSTLPCHTLQHLIGMITLLML